jgi:ADP-ribose pyrophosphatase YjhB (NUDIX family)
MSLLRENVKREVAEEARVKQLTHLNHTGVVFQGREDDYPPNTYFQYHIFSGYAHPTQIENAFADFAWIAEHPEEFKKFRADQREKDAIDWYNPERKMMGRWSPTLVKMYLEHLK